MGYTRDFHGSITLSRSLSDDELKIFNGMTYDFEIIEKEMNVINYESRNSDLKEDLEKIIRDFFIPKNISLEGELYWFGEMKDDIGYYQLENGKDTLNTFLGRIIYEKI